MKTVLMMLWPWLMSRSRSLRLYRSVGHIWWWASTIGMSGPIAVSAYACCWVMVLFRLGGVLADALGDDVGDLPGLGEERRVAGVQLDEVVRLGGHGALVVRVNSVVLLADDVGGRHELPG